MLSNNAMVKNAEHRFEFREIHLQSALNALFGTRVSDLGPGKWVLPRGTGTRVYPLTTLNTCNRNYAKLLSKRFAFMITGH